MSLKCCSTAAAMEISRKLTPRLSARPEALFFVRLVVPKPGIETAVIPVRGRCRESKARTVTSSAKVESSPPERPITADFPPVWRRRVFKPSACIVRISSQRSYRSEESDGTNGRQGKVRRSSSGAGVRSNGIVVQQQPLCQVVMRRRSWIRRCRSMSAQVRPVVNSGASAKRVPFSAIRLCPENTMSVEDSPSPASA